MSKHTPGPWHMAGWFGSLKGDKSASATTGRHASVWAADKDTLLAVTGLAGDAESDANARLIAAAPELLAALKALVAVCDEGNLSLCGRGGPDNEDYRNHCPECRTARKAIAKAEGAE